ncbi:hypothetical protein PAHAL_6G049200 [Panicum hallii]|uniref:Uncharacterized protein n=1 Tax=Panicum hallii TaxID=206008 RepID=A0A2T8IF92_9POAL|nr:hypothetical protein PAHAL_6G049200 [Panicum hallii]
MASSPWSRLPCLGMLSSCFSAHEEAGGEIMAQDSRGLAIAEGNGGNGGIHHLLASLVAWVTGSWR